MIEDSIYDTGNEAFRDRMSNTTEDGKRNWFYVSKSSGKFTRWRNYLNFFYFALFFTLPLLRYHDRPFFMINFPKGEFADGSALKPSFWKDYSGKSNGLLKAALHSKKNWIKCHGIGKKFGKKD